MDFIGEFVLGVFKETEADAGGVHFKEADSGNIEKGFEPMLLFRKAHFIEAQDGADEVKIVSAFDDGNDGAVAIASNIDAGEEITAGIALRAQLAFVKDFVEGDLVVRMEKHVKAIG
jgi:hypothetical protein